MNTRDTLKEYYINLQKMYNNAVNMLTAINQSLSTSSTEVLVNVMDTDDTYTTVRIPSFLYLENKLEQLESNFNNLFNIPASGEAWFNLNDGMQKLELVKATSSPLKPVISSTDKLYVQTAVNNFLKDLVNPKTFIRLYIDNLPNNINDIFVKKITITNMTLFDRIKKQNDNSSTGNKITYDRLKEILFNYNLNDDYYEYDSEIKTPLKRDRYRSEFTILDIPSLPYGNPWIEYVEKNHNHTRYKIRVNTLTYYDKDDSAYEYRLKQGDLLCLDNENVIYKIIEVSNTTNSDNEIINTLVIEEQLGHQVLQTTFENQNMVLRLYNEDFSEYKYVDVPLEEDPYIIVYIGTIYNNIRSILTDPVIIDLNKIEVRDSDGNTILENGTAMNYINYYNKYCNNIGDTISGLSQTIYPQLSNYTPTEILSLIDNIEIQQEVNRSIMYDQSLEVVKINSHIVDDDIINQIKKWSAEKDRINNDLTNIQNNIDNIYNQLIETDFSENLSTNQLQLQSKLTEYYNERTLQTKQKISIIENINIYKNEVKNSVDSKFRIRGVTNPTGLIEYLKSLYGEKTDVIGIDVRYKYVSTTKNTSSATNIKSSTFTNWVKQPTIDRDRCLYKNNSSYYIDFFNYNQIDNPIKWNQIDIPIVYGEDVVIKIRYKLNIGQPFIDIYTPWSDELTQTFPVELRETTSISNIMDENKTDVIGAMFNKTLINEGYVEHITQKMIDGSKVFFHDADTINSGFINENNKLLSMKEKIDLMDEDIYEYKKLIYNEIHTRVKVYAIIDDMTIELSPDLINELPAFNQVSDMSENNIKFTKNKIVLKIENTSDIPLTIYSMFPGNVETPLREYNMNTIFNGDTPDHYKNVLLCYNENSSEPADTIFEQTAGQWLYFRNDRPYTYEKLYIGEPFNEYEIYDNTSKNMQYMYNEQNAVQISNNNGIMMVDYSTTDDTTAGDRFKNYHLIYEHLVNNDSEEEGGIHFSEDGVLSQNDLTILQSTMSDSVFVPMLLNKNDILCDSINNNDGSQTKTIGPHNSVDVPVIFEHILTSGSLNSKTSKTIVISFKPTRLREPLNYIIKATGI